MLIPHFLWINPFKIWFNFQGRPLQIQLSTARKYSHGVFWSTACHKYCYLNSERSVLSAIGIITENEEKILYWTAKIWPQCQDRNWYITNSLIYLDTSLVPSFHLYCYLLLQRKIWVMSWKRSVSQTQHKNEEIQLQRGVNQAHIWIANNWETWLELFGNWIILLIMIHTLWLNMWSFTYSGEMKVGFLIWSLIWMPIYTHIHQESAMLRKTSSKHIFHKW